MVCPICGGELEQGRIEIAALGSSDTSTIINWYPESEFQKKGVGSIFKKNGKTVCDKCSRQTEAWHCPRCKKVCALLALK